MARASLPSLHARTAGGSRLRSRISGTNTRDRLHLVLDRQNATRIKTAWEQLLCDREGLVSRTRVGSFLIWTAEERVWASAR